MWNEVVTEREYHYFHTAVKDPDTEHQWIPILEKWENPKLYASSWKNTTPPMKYKLNLHMPQAWFWNFFHGVGNPHQLKQIAKFRL